MYGLMKEEAGSNSDLSSDLMSSLCSNCMHIWLRYSFIIKVCDKKMCVRGKW